MQRANTKLDFVKNKATMLGEDIDLMFTSNGHYYIPLVDENECISFIQNTEDDKSKIALKLHKQFSHPSSDKLIKLLNDGGINDKILEKEVRKIDENCEICFKYKKPKPRPVVCKTLQEKTPKKG